MVKEVVEIRTRGVALLRGAEVQAGKGHTRLPHARRGLGSTWDECL